MTGYECASVFILEVREDGLRTEQVADFVCDKNLLSVYSDLGLTVCIQNVGQVHY
jgi:hypothetical protein